MEFNFSKRFENTPKYSKIKQFDIFLEKLSDINKIEFSKEIYTSKTFMVISMDNEILKYHINHKVPIEIQKLIEDELWKIFAT